MSDRWKYVEDSGFNIFLGVMVLVAVIFLIAVVLAKVAS